MTDFSSFLNFMFSDFFNWFFLTITMGIILFAIVSILNRTLDFFTIIFRGYPPSNRDVFYDSKKNENNNENKPQIL